MRGWVWDAIKLTTDGREQRSGRETILLFYPSMLYGHWPTTDNLEIELCHRRPHQAPSHILQAEIHNPSVTPKSNKTIALSAMVRKLSGDRTRTYDLNVTSPT